MVACQLDYLIQLAGYWVGSEGFPTPRIGSEQAFCRDSADLLIWWISSHFVGSHLWKADVTHGD